MDNKLDRENYSQESNMEETEECRPADGRIVVKLILPRMPEVAPPEEEIKSHYCKECDKSFSSGKALGGHMSSAHVQANKDHSVKKLKSRIKKHRKDGTGSSLGPTPAVNICEICWKNFPSKKSLFGHMRKHPDRDWRGMNPPPSSQDQKIKSPPANSPETESEDDYRINDAAVAAELDLSLNWAMRAKRGGRGTAIRPPQAEAVINSPPRPDFPISDNEILVARQLMKLFNSIEDQDEEGVSTNQPKRKKDYSCESTKKRKSTRVCESVPNLKICEREGNNDAANSHCRRNIENNNAGKGKKKKKECKSKDSNGTSSSSGSFTDDIDSGEEINLTAINDHLKNSKKVAEISPEKYTCDKCNKSFPSHQALGGHSSSHSKFKMSIINSTNGKITSVRNRVNIAIRENCGSPVDDDDDNEDKPHMCKNNRRCHVDDENKKSAVKVVLDFDLNEEPAVEQDPSS